MVLVQGGGERKCSMSESYKFDSTVELDLQISIKYCDLEPWEFCITLVPVTIPSDSGDGNDEEDASSTCDPGGDITGAFTGTILLPCNYDQIKARCKLCEMDISGQVGVHALTL